MGRLVLASASPRRKELLEQAGIAFTVEAADVDENIDVTEPAAYVMELSRRKAWAVATRRGSEPGAKEETVLGADTVVVCDGRILGKPADAGDAVEMLRMLSGREHEVYTGVTLLGADGEKTFFECTRVVMYDNDEATIQAYVDTGEPLDKAGAYGIQGRGALLVKEIHGDYNNVVGLPVARVAREIGFGK